ncbi:hypothetical protein ABBQ32_013358 [Trebouxia sp. C0010 RCD-2024]
MSSEEKSWINWDDSPKWIGTALAISILLLKSLITYLVGVWQDKQNPQPPPPGTASPGVARNPTPVLTAKEGCKDEDGEACAGAAPLQKQQPASAQLQRLPGKVLYGSQKGTAATFAKQLARQAATFGVELQAVDLQDYEVEQLWKEHLVLLVLSTYENGQPPHSARWFCQWLEESSTDFRVGSGSLTNLSFAVFGCGNSLYSDHFNTVGRTVDCQLAAMSGQRLASFGCGDEESGKLQEQFQSWAQDILEAQTQQADVAAAVDTLEPVIEQDVASEGYATSDNESSRGEGGAGSDETPPAAAGSDNEIDMEDLGGRTRSGKTATTSQAAAAEQLDPREMLTPALRANLSKQGYKLIGSHSGVKLCRWTKSMLRGRGGCYKHSFYGIESHRCMETTPSLACANKCVFCWRHHTNPVGREWRWKMDDPLTIVCGAIDNHVKMINEYKGVPGVQAGRLQEGYQVRHCALSLVGEPIMYPEINAILTELHRRHISSFLVTNAQFPDRIRHLVPITQLYVSVDAATRDTLKAIDRPLFKDFWERFRECLTLLRDKQQRTVYRLTLVKGWNMEEIGNYAALLDLGKPDFIEIKGVTYCGSSGASSLTMQNVPYHADVCQFGGAICAARNGEYGLACEHAHSCCVLLARKDRFWKDGRWHTWIDYDKFQALAAAAKPFVTTDYMLPTPEWAVYGAYEAGFDPQEMRFKKVRNHPKVSAVSQK